MAGLLEGHRAVVTGAASGIGQAIAVGYAGQGAEVIILETYSAAAEHTVGQIEATCGRAVRYELDVTDR